MDPHQEKTSGLGLPQPSTEQSAAGFGAHHSTHGREIRPITMDAPPLPFVPPADSAAPVPMPAQPIPILTGADPAAAAAAQAADNPSDEDIDALDEEWVNKAKAIVDRTKGDPYLESKEISKAKADYLRVRYNKKIKIAEEQH
jgi:hypothetical protein